MADEKSSKSASNLLNYFGSKASKSNSDTLTLKSNNEVCNDRRKTIDSVKDDNMDSKKRKKTLSSQTSVSKKVKLSLSSDGPEVDSGLSSAGNSVNPECEVPVHEEKDGSVHEVSYLDFMDSDDSVPVENVHDVVDDSLQLLELNKKEVDENDASDCSRAESSMNSDKNQPSLMSFFSKDKRRNPLKNVSSNTDIECADVSGKVDKNAKKDRSVKSNEKEKKTQMTFSMAGGALKVPQQEIDRSVDEASIVVVGPSQETKKNKMKRKIKNQNLEDNKIKKKDEAKARKLERDDAPDGKQSRELSFDDFADENKSKTQSSRSAFDVMAARKPRKTADVESESKLILDQKKSKKRGKSETRSSGVDDVQGSGPRRSSRRSKVLSSYVSQDIDEHPGDLEVFERSGVSGTRKAARSRSLEKFDATNVKEKKDTKLKQKKAKQILSKAKERDRNSNKAACTSKSDLSKAKCSAMLSKKMKKKTDDEIEVIECKTESKPTKMAAIFQTKKKMTKAEKKAEEEEKARRQAFLRGGIPAELRLQVAQSIQASDSISIYQPFPSLSQSHIGWEELCMDDGGIQKLVPVEERKIVKDTKNVLENLGQFVNLNDPVERRHKLYKNSRTLSQEDVDSHLERLKCEFPDFPVSKIFESLRKRRKNEVDSIQAEVEKSRQTAGPVVTNLSDHDTKSSKKKKLARRKAMVSEKNNVENVVTEETTVTPGTNDVDAMLVDVYAPVKSSDVIGNQNVKKRISAWLRDWKERVDREERMVRKMLERQRKKGKKISDLDDDSDFAMSDDDVSTGRSLSNTMLLTGDHGQGKTCMVYALAQELGYKVLEVNAANRRNGKTILAQLQEATQSQHVSKQTSSPSKTDGKSALFASLSKKAQPDATKALDALQVRQSTCLSLILFDEVNVVFEEDKGFWQAIDSFMRSTKKPMILTTSDRNFRHHFEYPVEEVIFNMPQVSDVCCYLNLVCLVEGFRVQREELNNLVCAYAGDIRKCLNAIQFWMLSGGAARHDSALVGGETEKPRISDNNASNTLQGLGSDSELQEKGCSAETQTVVAINKESSDAMVHTPPVPTSAPSQTESSHLNLCESVFGLDYQLMQFLHGRPYRMNSINTGDFAELIYANSRQRLPLAKQVTSLPYPHLSNESGKSSNGPHEPHDVPQRMESDDVPEKMEKNVDYRVSELKSLDSIAKMMDSFSFSDSFLSSADEPQSEFVLKTAGMEDTQDFRSHSSLDTTRTEMMACVGLLGVNVARQRLRSVASVAPIPVQGTDAVFRLSADFDVDCTREERMLRCRSDVGEKLGPLVAMDKSSLTMDYVPTLRHIVRTEEFKQSTASKRRFFHYLDNISLHLNPSTIKTLSSVL